MCTKIKMDITTQVTDLW